MTLARPAAQSLAFPGVFPQDHEPPRTKHKCFYIQNTKPGAHSGEHWTAIGRQPGRPYLFFDSFARKPSPEHQVRKAFFKKCLFFPTQRHVPSKGTGKVYSACHWRKVLFVIDASKLRSNEQKCSRASPSVSAPPA